MGGPQADGSWHISLSREIRRFRSVQSLDDYRAIQEQWSAEFQLLDACPLYRDTLAAGFLPLQHPSHDDAADIVLPRAGEPVNLVDDHVVDVALIAQPGEHGLQLRPVGRLGALAPVDVFVNDGRAELVSGPVARLALCRNRSVKV